MAENEDYLPLSTMPVNAPRLRKIGVIANLHLWVDSTNKWR